jgi:hypothetical protein
MPARDVNLKPTFPESDPAFQEVPINEVGMNHRHNLEEIILTWTPLLR